MCPAQRRNSRVDIVCKRGIQHKQKIFQPDFVCESNIDCVAAHTEGCWASVDFCEEVWRDFTKFLFPNQCQIIMENVYGVRSRFVEISPYAPFEIASTRPHSTRPLSKLPWRTCLDWSCATVQCTQERWRYTSRRQTWTKSAFERMRTAVLLFFWPAVHITTDDIMTIFYECSQKWRMYSAVLRSSSTTYEPERIIHTYSETMHRLCSPLLRSSKATWMPWRRVHNYKRCKWYNRYTSIVSMNKYNMFNKNDKCDKYRKKWMSPVQVWTHEGLSALCTHTINPCITRIRHS